MREMISLREAMDRLFNDAFTRPLDFGISWQMPAIDMYQTDDDVIVKATLPGIKASDVQISVTGDMLTVKGELKEKEEVKEKAYHIREHRCDSFERSLSLPTDVWTTKPRPSSRMAS